MATPESTPIFNSHHPLYSRWRGMIYRCSCPTSSGYQWYGARGITVCKRWRASFAAFCKDMGDPPGPDYTLHRIDNDKGYSSSNVRWATPQEQQENVRPWGSTAKAQQLALPLTYGRVEDHPLHDTWRSMCRRCHDANFPQYPNYGARGIRVCTRWRHSFAAFFADVGIKPGPDYSLDRIDTNGHYEPDNVRWSTQLEQCRNKRNNRLITIGDITQISAEWERQNGLPPGAIARRVVRGGWSEEEAATRPMQAQASKNTFLPVGTTRICKERGMPYSVVAHRVRQMGWSFERALETPILQRGTWNAKLSAADHEHILARLAQGETQQVIAHDYGIDRSQISRLLTRRKKEKV